MIAVRACEHVMHDPDSVMPDAVCLLVVTGT